MFKQLRDRRFSIYKHNLSALTQVKVFQFTTQVPGWNRLSTLNTLLPRFKGLNTVKTFNVVEADSTKTIEVNDDMITSPAIKD